jgi:hypothetical protein
VTLTRCQAGTTVTCVSTSMTSSESSPDLGGLLREADREPVAIIWDSLSWLRRPLTAVTNQGLPGTLFP